MRRDLLGSMNQLTPCGCLATAPCYSEPHLTFLEPGRTLINPAGWNKTLLIHLSQRRRIRMFFRNPLYFRFLLPFQQSQVLLIIAAAEVRGRRDLLGVCIPPRCQTPWLYTLGDRGKWLSLLSHPWGTATSHPLVKEQQLPAP